MKRKSLQQALCLGFTIGVLLTGCKSDPPIYPVTETPGNTIPNQPSNPVDTYGLTASTLISGTDKIPQPSRVCTTINGIFYITSMTQGKVFKVISGGVVSTVLKNVNNPLGLKADLKGNIYVMITGDNKIMKITPGGKATEIKINMPINGAQDLAIADDGTIYIADTGNQRILKVDTYGNAVVFAGKINVSGLKDGTGSDAHFSTPTNIRLAGDGFLWVVDGNGVDKSSQTIRRITKSGQVNTYYLVKTKGVAINDFAVAQRDKVLNTSLVENLFLIFTNNTIMHLRTDGVEAIISPTMNPGFVNGDLKTAQFANPTGISISGANMYIVDQNNNALRKIVRYKIN